MIDCHCHILPGIDDGAHTFETALDMARAAAAAGIQDLVCTPHHLNGVYSNPGSVVRHALQDLRERLAGAGVPLRIHPGAELHLVPELPSQVLDGTALTYNDLGKAALVELPKAAVPMGAETILEQLLYRGITPVIAHPERNLVLVRNPERLAEWVARGCKVQLTAQSCSGDFGERIQHISRHWLELGWVHLIASDAHRPTGRSPTTLAAGRAVVTEWLGDQAASLLVCDNPRRLLDGADLLALAPHANPRRIRMRGRWLGFLPWRRRAR
ncbi:PHP C-terminal domain protein [Thiocapsa sp. KS1]|nr:CpsB/CapC family capsule biosynthesis tyrosine phosphatase [Thiocapsa sp. KS1]CRI66041.1 PHP C-terminal domain protein [Thiocapsa sp. KS1]